MTDDQSNGDDPEVEYETRPPAGMDDEDWTALPADPDPRALGYETHEWERIPTAEDDQIIFLPDEEADLEKDAFVVLEESALCDLVTRR